MDHSKVQLNYKLTEKEYLAAVRFYVWNSSELLLRLIIIYVLLSAGVVLFVVLLGFEFPVWALVALIGLLGVSIYHGSLVDLPRRYFRGDPKFRSDYSLTFADEGIEFKTQDINASISWSLYTRVIENDAFYLTIYGRDIHSVSILPKRAFVDSKQENAFRKMLRRHVDHSLKLGPTESENTDYFPPTAPPDWR